MLITSTVWPLKVNQPRGSHIFDQGQWARAHHARGRRLSLIAKVLPDSPQTSTQAAQLSVPSPSPTCWPGVVRAAPLFTPSLTHVLGQTKLAKPCANQLSHQYHCRSFTLHHVLFQSTGMPLRRSSDAYLGGQCLVMLVALIWVTWGTPTTNKAQSADICPLQ